MARPGRSADVDAFANAPETDRHQNRQLDDGKKLTSTQACRENVGHDAQG